MAISRLGVKAQRWWFAPFVSLLDRLPRAPYSDLKLPSLHALPRPQLPLLPRAGRALADKDSAMDNRTYTRIEIVGVSKESYAAATKNAIDRASQTLKGLGWFEVTELRGLIQDGAVSEYQVTLKVGFRLLDASDL